MNPGGANKPTGRSDAADLVPAESRAVLQRLGSLRVDLDIARRRRQLVRANVAAILFAALMISAEVAALATGLVAERQTPTAVAFAFSTLLGQSAAALALERLAKMPDQGDLLTSDCRSWIGWGAAAGIFGAFLAAWPS